jgi:hypothetical protein
LFTTLEIFGLPSDYINGNGHHAMWAKEKGGDDKKKKGKKKKAQPKGAAAKLAKSMGVKTSEVEVRPTFFDLLPFQRALRKFLTCSPEARANIRSVMFSKSVEVRDIFRDKYKEQSSKRIMDIHEMTSYLHSAGIVFDGLLGESLGSLFVCFGDI